MDDPLRVMYRSPGLAVLCLLFSTSMAFAESISPFDSRAGLLPTAAVRDSDPAVPPQSAAAAKKPGAKESRPPRYPSDPPNYQSCLPRVQAGKSDPNSAAAQQQSGLSQPQATSLMTSQGYTRIGDVHADPNSIWVWQADAMKNGRPVRLGIDHKGTLVETSSGLARPCTQPGAGFATGSIGVGARLSEATSCSR